MRYNNLQLFVPSMINHKNGQKSIKKHNIHALRGPRNVHKLLVSMLSPDVFEHVCVAKNTCTYLIWRARCGRKTSHVAENGGKKGDLEAPVSPRWGELEEKGKKFT